ncbi:hypothetical protein TRAPUB_9406 [Trametes pubescens]|uniref:Uncharacterized protein n=1 Tax=Trametes pubescens TaxID=154538 RepID=A0A1M2W2G8_TRAPU|nr:hypothetical protein TRAPUB_9406 [Trametes pubescens]
MLSSLSRIFQPSAAPNTDQARPLVVAEKDTDSNAKAKANGGANENSLRLVLGSSQHSDSAPLLGRHHTPSHLSLHSGMPDSPRAGPSHVSWKTPTPSLLQQQQQQQRQSGQESPASSHTQVPTPTPGPMWGPQGMSMNRTASASSPSLLTTPLSTASASNTYRPGSVGKRSSLSVGFTADSDDSDGDSVRSSRSANANANVPKPLSPIHELHHFPPQRMVSMDSGLRTPDSTKTFDRIGGVSPAQNAFLNRPLKRSTSQTSNSTFRSNISTAAPTIPPLDLRPDFQNAVGVPHGPHSPGLLAPPPRKSRLASPALPTVIGSPTIQTNKVSVIYEDGASARTSASFITAPSLNSPDAEAAANPPPFVARDYAHSDGTETDTEETDATQRARRPLPEGLFDVDLLNAEFGVRPTSRSSLRPPSASTGSPRAYTRSASPATSSESFLQRRWLKGLSFGSDRFVLPPGSVPKHKAQASHACMLFWLGFVAPWCWLIGGWLLTRAGAVSTDGLAAETGPVLPLWHRRRKNSGPPPPLDTAKGKESEKQDTNVPVPERVKSAAERRIKAKSWYPLVAPSLESLTPSTGSGSSTRKLKRCLPSSSRRGVDPWIHRCRMAAAASGVLIFAAFVVAIVLVAGVRM